MINIIISTVISHAAFMIVIVITNVDTMLESPKHKKPWLSLASI